MGETPYSRFLEEEYLFSRLDSIFDGQSPNPNNVGVYLACGALLGMGRLKEVRADIFDWEEEIFEGIFELGREAGEALRRERGTLSKEDFEEEMGRISWRVGKYLVMRKMGGRE